MAILMEQQEGQCHKRTYASKNECKRAHRTAGWRMRIYWCDECKGYHATNEGKKG